MATTTIPAAIDAIIALLRASSDLRGIEIIDGQPTTNTAKDFIAVAFVEDGGQVVSGYQQMVTMGNMLQDETFDVVCRVSAWNGGTDMKKVRDRAFTLFAGVEKAIRASNTLSSNVLFAYIQPVNYSQYQTEQGAVADLDFSITVRAAYF